MLNDHHQIDPHIYENEECLPVSVMEKSISPEWLWLNYDDMTEDISFQM